MKEKKGKIFRCIIFSLAIIIVNLNAVQAQCTEDCVWPGDLNANGIANNVDFLAIGIALGETGPIRPGSSNVWEAQEAENWGQNLPILGADYKHIDADGNGIITDEDKFPIAVNYNQTNENFAGLLGNDLEGDDLFIVPENTVAVPGGSLFFDVHLGTVDSPIEDLYGIAFRLDIDTQYVQDVLFDFSESWIGEDEEYLGYGKFSDEIDHAGTAITRVDGNTISGFGKIARIEIVIIDVILGFEADTTVCLPFPVRFEKVLAIDNEEGDLMLGSKGETLNLKHPSQLTDVKNLAKNDLHVHIHPNPAQDFLWIESEEGAESVIIFNQLGQQILHQKFSNTRHQRQRIDLKSASISSGFYFVEVLSNNMRTVKRIFIQKE